MKITKIPFSGEPLSGLQIMGVLESRNLDFDFPPYLRNITLRPSLAKDWLYFLFTILVANSINYFLLVLFFSIEINYYEILGNIIFTFLLYYIFAYIFDIYRKILLRIKI